MRQIQIEFKASYFNWKQFVIRVGLGGRMHLSVGSVEIHVLLQEAL